MKATTYNYDHRETPKAKDLKVCEDFVGEGHHLYDEGVDDGYCIWYWSADVPSEIQAWCVEHKYMTAFALNDIEFDSIDDFYAKVCQELLDMDDECELPPHPMAITVVAA